MKRKQPTYFQRVYPLTLLTLTITICITQQWLRTGSIVPQGFEVEAQGREQQAGVTAEIQTLSPTPTPTLTPPPTPVITDAPHKIGEVEDSSETKSMYIEDAVNEFLPDHKSESLMIMHCLAHRESGHGASNAHGDNGLAGGPFQFHEATWTRMRKQMGEPLSTRYDFKESARTTAWAIANGRALEWGPILRASQGSSYASCQVPSWYKK